MDGNELIISYLFPPSQDIAGIVFAKRIIINNKKVDVLTTNQNSKNNVFSDIVNENVQNRYTVEVNLIKDEPDAIKQFIEKSSKVIKKDYEIISSMSWPLTNHLYAFEYKLKHPDTYWKAEFSDPLLYNTENKISKAKKFKINNPDYFKRINKHIRNLGFPEIENHTSTYFIAEYLTYLFADEIIFPNENQRDLMIGQFPIDIKKHVMSKSTISPHPTLPSKFYQISSCKLELDNDYINIAYFGNFYYGDRHFETIFYALESLNHKFKNKIRFYFFITNKKLLKTLIKNLNFKENIFIKKPMDYLEFLNATTKFDVLVVNDLITKENWSKNPYLPSKYSDYLGSESDIWAITEKNSTLSKINVKYKSDVNDYPTNIDVLVKILEDHNYIDENYTIIEGYFEKRLTELNKVIEKTYAKSLRNKKSKKEKDNNMINKFKKIF